MTTTSRKKKKEERNIGEGIIRASFPPMVVARLSANKLVLLSSFNKKRLNWGATLSITRDKRVRRTKDKERKRERQRGRASGSDRIPREGRQWQRYSKIRGRYTIGGGKFRSKTISGRLCTSRYGKAGRKKRLSCLACYGDPAYIAGSEERFTRIYVYTRVYACIRIYVHVYVRGVCAACFMLRVCTSRGCMHRATCSIQHAPCTVFRESRSLYIKIFRRYSDLAVSQRSWELKSS